MENTKIKMDNGNTLVYNPSSKHLQATVTLLDKTNEKLRGDEYLSDEEAQVVFCLYAAEYYEAKAKFIVAQGYYQQ